MLKINIFLLGWKQRTAYFGDGIYRKKNIRDKAIAFSLVIPFPFNRFGFSLLKKKILYANSEFFYYNENTY